MGNRALLQLRNKNEVSPLLYLHWGGSEVGEIIRRTKSRIAHRHDDVIYAFARPVQEAINGMDGDSGFGVWNQDEVLTEADSHGDAGCFVIDLSTPERVTAAFGRYGLDAA